MGLHLTKQRYSRQYLRDVLQWDISTWKRALYYWDTVLQEQLSQEQTTISQYALEIGARDGGLSLFLAEKNMEVVCSDIGGPTTKARDLHRRYAVAEKIEYADIDAVALPFADSHFDLVIFKSVLGAVGQFKGISAVDGVLAEVYRVLKPGGLVLFAENQEGSRFHQWARNRFVPWGSTYYYIPQQEVKRLFRKFTAFDYRTYGFFSCVRKDFWPLTLLDWIICLPKRSTLHYMIYGHALK